MKAHEVLEMIEGMKNYDDGLTVLQAGSIDRALAVFTASQPRWQHCRFVDLPRAHQCDVLDLAALVEV